MKSITILMSTYNAERYLEEQLESIESQDAAKSYALRLFIRDDGSTDNTVARLQRWMDRLHIELIEGHNIGARNSFFWLLENAPESDYYAFCDQDDIWYTNKLSKAINKMMTEKELYFCNVNYIDENGIRTGRKLLADNFELSLKRVMMCNPANGCTMVWDAALQKAIANIPKDTFTMHDEFLCTLGLLLGEVVYDNIPGMDYRVHSSNVTQSGNYLKKMKLRKEIWLGRKAYSLDKRASELLKHHIKSKYLEDLKELSEYKRGTNRYRLLFKYKCEDSRIQRSFRLRMLLKLL